MRQERLLSVGTDGGGYINLCINKDDLSLCRMIVAVTPTMLARTLTATSARMISLTLMKTTTLMVVAGLQNRR